MYDQPYSLAHTSTWYLLIRCLWCYGYRIHIFALFKPLTERTSAGDHVIVQASPLVVGENNTHSMLQKYAVQKWHLHQSVNTELILTG